MNKGSTLHGSLLVAGTSIGGGMLALPILTSQGGFIPSLLIYFFCWLFMASTGLLFLEVSLSMKGESNIISMADRTLGKVGVIFAWGLYLFLFYCLTLAYIVGCGNLLAELFNNSIPDWAAFILFLAFFLPFIYLGPHVTGKINILFMIGLGISFCIFVFLGFTHVNLQYLHHRNWPLSLMGLPIAFTAFAYQGIIPTLVTYMHYDVKKTKLAILIGSFLPLIAYVIWQWLILGIVPLEGPHGLKEAMENGENAVHPLKYFINTTAVYVVGQFFAFFALVTSFFGVTLGMIDFLADGLRIKKTAWGKVLLVGLVILPPLLIALYHPHVFLQALDYAGGFGCALLLGLLPILMVWSLRYYKKGPTLEKTIFPGGRIALTLLLIFVLFEIACEWYFHIT